MSRKIAVGISGGVDSCAAAYILKSQGFEVLGVTLRLNPSCHAEADIESARAVAEAVGIEHRVVDLEGLFAERVISPFVAEYIAGRTPNPCVICNREIKFGAMLDYALSQGCDALATGHYARVERENGRYVLKRADSAKDQSYFLCNLTQEQLAHAVFPLCSAEKSEIRALALEAGLPAARRKDSQEICFVPDDDYISFLTSRGVSSPQGNIVDRSGAVLGRHSGITNYTVGQRKGLGAYGKPMFVTKIDAAQNTVTIGGDGEQYSACFIADNPNYIAVEGLVSSMRVQVKIRFRAKPAPATLTALEGGRLKCVFDSPQRSVTPGQFAVFYDGDSVICGARIISAGD